MLRRHLDPVRSRAQEAEIGVVRIPRPAARDRRQRQHARAPRNRILAHAEEGEVVVGQPVEELHRLGHRALLHAAQLPRFELGDDSAQPLEHPLPAADGPADIAEHFVDLALHRGARIGRRQGIDVDVEHALEHRPLAARRLEHAVGIAVDRQDRVRHEPHRPALGAYRTQHAIDEERHVRREHLDDLGAVLAQPAARSGSCALAGSRWPIRP